jgi:hypothetical protein
MCSIKPWYGLITYRKVNSMIDRILLKSANLDQDNLGRSILTRVDMM